jgi:hypothetical protein
MAIVQPRTQRNPRAKTHHRRRNHVPCARPTRPHLLRLILRHEYHLRIRRLDHHHLHIALLLHRNRLVLITVERASCKCILTQGLNRRHHWLLICPERIPQRRIVIDVVRHHVYYGRKVHQRDKRRIEPMLLCRIRQRLPLQIAILHHPVMHIEDLLRIRRSRTYLRHQRIRKQSKRSHQLFQLILRRHRLSINRVTRPETPHRNQQCDHQNLAKGHCVTPHNQSSESNTCRVGQVAVGQAASARQL